MAAYLRNPLTLVWAFLTLITLASWWISQGSGVGFHANTAVTLSVLLLAVVKVHFVMRYFMEVRHAPIWLRRITSGWLLVLCLLLCGIYLAGA
jgi:heme/copper-type cytochrome/quinol oxidase subunit 4